MGRRGELVRGSVPLHSAPALPHLCPAAPQCTPPGRPPARPPPPPRRTPPDPHGQRRWRPAHQCPGPGEGLPGGGTRAGRGGRALRRRQGHQHDAAHSLQQLPVKHCHLETPPPPLPATRACAHLRPHARSTCPPRAPRQGCAPAARCAGCRGRCPARGPGAAAPGLAGLGGQDCGGGGCRSAGGARWARGRMRSGGVGEREREVWGTCQAPESVAGAGCHGLVQAEHRIQVRAAVQGRHQEHLGGACGGHGDSHEEATVMRPDQSAALALSRGATSATFLSLTCTSQPLSVPRAPERWHLLGRPSPPLAEGAPGLAKQAVTP